MYQPISFNVIRQALEWHGLPVPTLRQLSHFNYDPDNVSAEYLATWTAEQLRQRFGMAELNAVPWQAPVFVQQVRNCFCEDVRVMDPEYNLINGSFRVIFYVTISREVIAAASGDWL